MEFISTFTDSGDKLTVTDRWVSPNVVLFLIFSIKFKEYSFIIYYAIQSKTLD